MYICIEGNIGAGKTTVAKALAKRKNAGFLGEIFEDNPLLPLFYKNKKQMAFLLECSFLISRHSQLHKHFSDKHKKITVADFSLLKCLWFAKTNLNKEEFALYKTHFKIIETVVKVPQLIIYINTHHKNLLKNIKRRGRSYEKDISKKYLANVSESYKTGLKKVKGIPVIEFYVNFYSKRTHETIVNQIDDILKKGITFKYREIIL